MPHLSKVIMLKKWIKHGLDYIQLLWRRMEQDRVSVLAGHLAYVSLLALVPLVTVVFALFAIFPMFSAASIQLKTFIFNNFVPAAGDTIQFYLEQFVTNSNKMTAVGICGLVITALLLINAIDNALNQIWRNKNHRPMIYSFAVYWMILTLGPLLAGGSMALSSIFLSQSWFNNANISAVLEHILRLLPLILSFCTFCLMYSVVPNVRVPLKDAASGALVAALLFEFGKKMFGLYVIMFPSYQLIYGVLAVIPILFVWVYLSWFIVLIGAEITVTFSQHRALRDLAKQATGNKPTVMATQV